MLVDGDEPDLDEPVIDQLDFVRDGDPTAGASDIGGRAGDADGDEETTS